MSETAADPALRILKIWDAEYPWDVRAEKVAGALTEAGHEVLMVARNRDGRPRREQLDECGVLRMSPIRGCPGSLDRMSQFPAFMNPRWKRLVDEGIRAVQADVLLVRDLPLAPVAFRAGRRWEIPVVLDMAENYPAMMRDLWLTGTQGPFDFVVRNPKIVRWVEEWAVARMDHIIVVVEESAQRLREMGVAPERITVVGNTPPGERVASKARHASTEVPRVSYLGLIEEARGVRTLLDALALCKQEGHRVFADVIGDGRDRPAMMEYTERQGLSDHVTFHGFLPHKEALQLVAGADWGVIPHHANESWNTTIPNKLFDYMAAGLAVVASDAAPVKRVVLETGCGAVFPDRDAVGLAGVLMDTSVEDRLQYGEAGRGAAREKYHWERDAARLLDSMKVVTRHSRHASTRNAVHVSP